MKHEWTQIGGAWLEVSEDTRALLRRARAALAAVDNGRDDDAWVQAMCHAVLDRESAVKPAAMTWTPASPRRDDGERGVRRDRG